MMLAARVSTDDCRTRRTQYKPENLIYNCPFEVSDNECVFILSRPILAQLVSL